MRLCVSGSRDYVDRAYLFGVLDGIHASQDVTVLIHGAARGADQLADEWAASHRIKRLPFPADWNAHRPKDPTKKNPAGAIRNRHMLESGRPELVVAFPLPGSRGTIDMIQAIREAGVEVWIFTGPKVPSALGAARTA